MPEWMVLPQPARAEVGERPILRQPISHYAETALDRYVKKPDPTYRYDLVRTTPGEGYTTYTIDLTSQTWRSPADVDHSVWKHWLTIVKPDRVTGARSSREKRSCPSPLAKDAYRSAYALRSGRGS